MIFIEGPASLGEKITERKGKEMEEEIILIIAFNSREITYTIWFLEI
jgi:hypothetical protein